MLTRAIGEILPAAIVVGLSPIAIIAVVLVLGSARARVNGPLFALGWVVGLTAIAAIGVIAFSGIDTTSSDKALAVDWLRIAIGVGLVVIAGKKWTGRPRPGEPVDTPGWMASLDSVGPRRALVLGLALGGVNPKNIAFGLAAAASIAEVGLDAGGTVVAIAVFVTLGSSAVLGAVVAHAVFGARADRPLAAVKEFMAANNAVIMMVLFLVFGVKVIGDGLQGLSS